MNPIIEKDKHGFFVINVKAEKLDAISDKTIARFKSEGTDYVLSFENCFFQPRLDKTDVFVIAKQTSRGVKLFALVAVNRALYKMFSEIQDIEDRMNALKRFMNLSIGERNNIFLQMGNIKWSPDIHLSKMKLLADLQLKYHLCKDVMLKSVARLYRQLLDCSVNYDSSRPLTGKEYLNICFSNDPVHYSLTDADIKALKERTFLTDEHAEKLVDEINGGATRILLVGSVYDAEFIAKALADVLRVPFSSRDIGSYHAGFELLGDKSVWNESSCNILTEMMIETMSDQAVFVLNSVDALGSSREHGSAKKALRKLLAKDIVYDPFYTIDLPISSSIIVCSAEDQRLIDQAALNCFDCIIDTDLSDSERVDQAKKFIRVNRLSEFDDAALKLIGDYSVDMLDYTKKLTRFSSKQRGGVISLMDAETMLQGVLPTDPYRLFKISKKLYPAEVVQKVNELHAMLIKAESDNEFALSVLLKDKLELLYGLKQHNKPNFDMDEFIRIASQRHIGHGKVIHEIAEFFNYLKVSGKLNALHAYFVGHAGTGKSDLGEAIGISSKMNVIRIDMPAINLDNLTGASDNHKVPKPSVLTKSIVNGPCVFLFEEFEKAGREIQNFCLKLMDSGHSFKDHYLGIDVSLDDCLFIATANDVPMLKCMLDRFRVFEFSPYTTVEKAELLDRFATQTAVAFDSAAKAEILNHCGGGSARPLKRAVERLSEHAVAKGVDTVNLELVNSVLGASTPVYVSTGEKHIGVVNGLAVGAQGGLVTQIEAKAFKSANGSMEVTGSVDDEIKEAASTGKDFLLGNELIDECRMHIHYPNAFMKGGNSSGAAMALAMYSAGRKLSIPDNIAVSGEISLFGKVLPVGGIPEKIEGAVKSGIKTVFIPSRNYLELKENAEYFDFLSPQIDIIPVESFEDILEHLALS